MLPLRIIPGAVVSWQGNSHIVLDLSDLDRAVVREIETGKTEQVPTAELVPERGNAIIREDLMVVPDEDWQQAVQRYEFIKPLLEGYSEEKRTAKMVSQAAQKAGVSSATLYRWLSRYEETGLVSSLLRPRRRDFGKTRLSAEAERLISNIIETHYLSRQRPSVAETCLEVIRQFRAAQIDPPHPNTVRARIGQLSERLRLSKRVSYKAAREKFTPLRGSFPNAEFPLAVVQIDHTKVDLTLVDDTHRLPIGRPYLTLAIDVCTRMIAGFYISLDPPSAMSAGLCIADAVLEKETRLARLGISSPWPIWGKMRKIHMDNAREFRGTMLERACREHGITLEHRPKGQPNYGGHIERAFLTFMKKTHNLPGTTFSNTQEKGEYDTDHHASMTLSEFEKWFTTFVVEVYHQKPHSGINGIPPIKLYEQAIMGTDDRPGIGMPLRVADERKFRLDFTPFVERTVQEYGVMIDGVHYYNDILRPYIHARDETNTRQKQKFIFARDPRDISTVYFFDPETRTYHPVGYRDMRRPAISIWELNAALRHLADDNILQPNEEMIFEGIRKMREIEQEAVAKTKGARSARRNIQRRKTWKQTSQPTPPAQSDLDINDDYPVNDITPFHDIREAE